MANLMRTSNPTLNDNTFRSEGIALDQTMTLTGTVNKTGLLLVCAMGTAAWAWNQTSRSPEQAASLAILGAIGGLSFALATVFKKSWEPVTAPIYALLQAFLLLPLSQTFHNLSP